MTNVLLALDNAEEHAAFRRTIAEQRLDYGLFIADSVNEADRMITAQGVDIIVTDLRFQNGGFAEWLYLWQHPFVLIADWQDYEQIGRVVIDQTSDFVIRDSEHRYIEYLPLVIKKILNNKESIDHFNYHLRMTEERYRELVQALPDIVYSLDTDGHIVFVNDSIRKLGWEPLDLIGQHFSVLIHKEDVDKVSRQAVLAKYRGKTTGPGQAPKLFDERRSGERRTQDLEIKLQRKNVGVTADEIFGAVTAYGEVNAVGFPVFGHQVGEPGTVGIIRDITQRKDSEALIHRSLKEKEMMLAEIHHRVKNNLQVISSLLNLQSNELADPEARRRFNNAQAQIQSMALVHEHLYQSDDFGAVDMPNYVGSLCNQLWDLHQISRRRVALCLEMEPIVFTIGQAMPLALLLNELITNALRYAFPGESSGSITIQVAHSGSGLVRLRVCDDGIGLPDGFRLNNSPGMGGILIESICSQLAGAFSFSAGRPGTVFELNFPLQRDHGSPLSR